MRRFIVTRKTLGADGYPTMVRATYSEDDILEGGCGLSLVSGNDSIREIKDLYINDPVLQMFNAAKKLNDAQIAENKRKRLDKEKDRRKAEYEKLKAEFETCGSE